MAYAPTISESAPIATFGRIGAMWTVSPGVWVPFFSATNVMGETNVPDGVLGMPLRLEKYKGGAIRFSDSGRPVMRVAPELNAQIGIVRENFVASLRAYTGMVQDERPDEYKGLVDAAQQAAQPFFEKTKEDIDQAIELLKAAEAAKNSQSAQTPPTTPRTLLWNERTATAPNPTRNPRRARSGFLPQPKL